MKICAGIVSWRDGDALENALQSVRPYVETIVLADGLIDGINTDLPPTSGELRLNQLKADYEIDAVASHNWRSQSEQRNWTFSVAKAHGCDWLLAIDADEELHNGPALRRWLELWGLDAFPIPFYFDDYNQGCPAAFKCIHLPDWRRYACQGSILENNRGELVQLIGQTWWSDARAAKMPYLKHRPELRPPERQDIRLSAIEVELEPYPADVKVWLEPTYSPMLLTPEGLLTSIADAARLGQPIWYCPGCGRRYAGPGSCSMQHETTGLEPVEVAA